MDLSSMMGVSRRVNFVSVGKAAAALSLLGCVSGAFAMSRTTARPRPHADAEPIPLHHTHTVATTKKPAPAKLHTVVASTRHPEHVTFASIHENPARSAKPATRTAPKPPAHIIPLVETVNVRTHITKPIPAPAAPRTIAAKPSAAPKTILAATMAAPTPKAFAAGVSHPDDFSDDQPLTAAVPKAPITAAIVSADPEPAADLPAPNHRTLAATMAAHKNDIALTTPEPIEAPEPAADIPALPTRDEITEAAAKPLVLPSLYGKDGRLVMPAPLKGTHDVLVHQNTMADSEGLERIQDDDQLQRMLAAHQLMRLPESSSLEVNEDLPVERRYARPWTVHFAIDIAHAFNARFGDPIRVNSAVRTVSFQSRLQHVNGNAAAISGEAASPHLTGQAIDIGKRGMSQAQIAWMRAYLGILMTAGKIDVEEEFQQACFHISVYRSYLPTPKKPTRLEVASTTAPATNKTTRTASTLGAIVSTR